VTLAVTSEKGAVTFVCSDRGGGMSEGEMQQALAPFHSSKAGGAGLGLPLSIEIIDAHRGSLKLSRRKSGGTRVTCTLPGRSPHQSQSLSADRVAAPRDVSSSPPGERRSSSSRREPGARSAPSRGASHGSR